MLAKSYMQPDVLVLAMEDVGISHGETARVTICGLRAAPSPVAFAGGDLGSRTRLFFCPMDRLVVTQTITPGDGGQITDRVYIGEQLRRAVPRIDCRFDVEGAILSTNGQTRLTIDQHSRVRVREEARKVVGARA